MESDKRRMLAVVETVYNSTFGVEAVFESVEVNAVPMLEVAECSVGDEVGELDEARGLGIEKYGDLGVVPGDSEAVARVLEVSGEGLDSTFGGRFVEENESALLIAFFPVEATEKLIETTAELLERHLSNVLTGEFLLIEHSTKQPHTAGVILDDANCKGIDDGLNSFRTGVFGPALASTSHGGSMQFD